jgi:hypothetical protein
MDFGERNPTGDPPARYERVLDHGENDALLPHVVGVLATSIPLKEGLTLGEAMAIPHLTALRILSGVLDYPIIPVGSSIFSLFPIPFSSFLFLFLFPISFSSFLFLIPVSLSFPFLFTYPYFSFRSFSLCLPTSCSADTVHQF